MVTGSAPGREVTRAPGPRVGGLVGWTSLEGVGTSCPGMGSSGPRRLWLCRFRLL